MNSIEYRIYPLSENCLTFQMAPVISEEQIRLLYHLKNIIEGEAFPVIGEILVTFQELTVIYDSTTLSFEALENEIRILVEEINTTSILDIPPPCEQFALPICYDETMAWDKSRLEEHSGLSFSEIITRHYQSEYTFYMRGFLPGFLYLGGLDERLSCPRLEEPRSKVLSGSVGIAGQQTGIYPMESPGGWNIIGRTPIRLFDFTRTEVHREDAMIQPLDKIIFHPITTSQFQDLQEMTWFEYQQNNRIWE